MHRVIELSKNSVKTGGGPFGAVIAKDGIIIAEASNIVTIDLDPTAHAEVNCIRSMFVPMVLLSWVMVRSGAGSLLLPWHG